jgi:hypothetical protein
MNNNVKMMIKMMMMTVTETAAVAKIIATVQLLANLVNVDKDMRV